MKLFHGMNWKRYIEHRKSSIRSKIGMYSELSSANSVIKKSFIAD